MRFLKTLQRVRDEERSVGVNGHDSSAEVSVAPPTPKTQAFLGDADLRIGTPKLEIAKKPQAVPNGSDAKVEPQVIGRPRLSGLPATTGRTVFGCEFTLEPQNVNERLIAVTQPQSAYCEDYRSLRTQVLHACRGNSLKSMVVLSAGPSEGKSVTAINLSWLLAQTEGVSALLVDADLRSPSLEDYLGIETHIGLSDLLDGKTKLTDAIVRLKPGGLHFLPPGGARSDMAELISGSRFVALHEELRNMFDFVIIDAPPLGLFSDAAALLNVADCGLLVVRSDYVKCSEVQSLMETLPADKLLGAVLNQSEEIVAGRSYYDYKYRRYEQ